MYRSDFRQIVSGLVYFRLEILPIAFSFFDNQPYQMSELNLTTFTFIATESSHRIIASGMAKREELSNTDDEYGEHP
ncbi:hypothetical protein PENTCL1PPCAC_3694, partial [Pristionchus entomophagus]